MSNVISLKKGQPISLKKGLHLGSKIRVAMGWTAKGTSGNVDLDVTGFELNATGRTPNASYTDVVFYYNLADRYGAIVHSPDDRKGQVSVDTDAEFIDIDFSKIPEIITRIPIVVTIDESDVVGQKFSDIDAAEVRIYDGLGSDKKVVASYNLAEDFSNFNALETVEFYRENGEWQIKRIGEGKDCSLFEFFQQYGVMDVRPD